MLKAVHPDLAVDEADRLERERLSRAVNDMCDTLLDPIRRYDYDSTLARARLWPEGAPDQPHRHDGPMPWGPSPAWGQGGASGRPPAPDPFEHDEWDTGHPDEMGPDPDAGNPLVERLPFLARFERWLTWRMVALALLMFGLATFAWNTGGARLLDGFGLHFGRFGSLAVVLLLTMMLVVLCLAVAHLVRFHSRRSSGNDGEA